MEFDPRDSGSSEEDVHHPNFPIFDDSFPWYVIVAIALVAGGLLIVVICVLWSCMAKYCCSQVPKKIGNLKVIERQPSIVSVQEDNPSYQNTYVTSISNLGEDYVHPTIFQVIPDLKRSNSNVSKLEDRDTKINIEEKKPNRFLVVRL